MSNLSRNTYRTFIKNLKKKPYQNQTSTKNDDTN
jgi:hypothetical protein